MVSNVSNPKNPWSIWISHPSFGWPRCPQQSISNQVILAMFPLHSNNIYLHISTYIYTYIYIYLHISTYGEVALNGKSIQALTAAIPLLLWMQRVHQFPSDGRMSFAPFFPEVSFAENRPSRIEGNPCLFDDQKPRFSHCSMKSSKMPSTMWMLNIRFT